MTTSSAGSSGANPVALAASIVLLRKSGRVAAHRA
jgi:hypothetical protein